MCWGAACQRGSEEAAASHSKAEPGVAKARPAWEAEFSYAELESTAAALPPRYSKPLPGTVEEASKPWAESPPQAMVADQICFGDPKMRQRLERAVQSAAGAGATASELVRAYDGARAKHCTRGSHCAWLRKMSLEASEPAAREFFWASLEHCDDPTTVEHFLRADAPARPLVTWYTSLYPRPEPLDPRVPGAAVAVSKSEGWGTHTHRVAYVLAQYDEPEAVGAVMEIFEHQQPQGPLRKSLLGRIAKKADPRVRAFVARHCQPLGEAECERLARVRVETEAREPASQAGPASGVPPKAEMTPAEIEALASRLDALGMTATLGEEDRELGLMGNDESPSDALSLMIARGNVHGFDTETGMFPNRHDGLLRELAQLVGEDLQGVVFEERAPRLDDSLEKIDPEEDYELIAYMDGKRHVFAARDLGDWFDVVAVVDFLNALCRERERRCRFVGLDSQDQMSFVLAGPGPALLELIRDGVVERIGDADTPRRIGVEAERRVFEQVYDSAP